MDVSGVEIMPKVDLDKGRCEEILTKAEVGFLGMCRNNRPYCLPFNFAYRDSKIYIHTGFKGTKWLFLNENPMVCFTVSAPGRKRTGKSPCQYTYEFESVMAYGRAVKVESLEEAREGLNLIIEKYREGPVTEVPEDKFAKVCLIRLDIDELRGRKNQ